MKGVFRLGLVLLLTSCQLSLVNPSNSTGQTETQQWADTSHTRLNDYLGSTLQWYEIYQYDPQGRTASYGHYTPQGILLYSHAYAYIGTTNQVQIDAYYDNTNALVSFDVYRYSNGNKIQDSLYDANSNLQSFSVWQYDSTGKLLQMYGNFDKYSILLSGTRTTYNAALASQPAQVLSYLVPSAASQTITATSPGPQDLVLSNEVDSTYTSTGTLLKQTNLANSAVSPNVAPSRSVSAVAGSARAIAFTVPSLPTNIPDGPSLLSAVVWPTASLTMNWWKYWEYDNWGSTEVDFNASNFPTRFVRTFNDGMLVGVTGSATMTTSITSDALNRITQEAVSYAGTTLNSDFTYGSSNSNLISQFDLSGSALVFPLSVQLSYNTNNSPSQINFLIPAQNGGPTETLGSLAFSYNSSASTPIDVVSVPSLDPLKLYGQVNTIQAYLGSGTSATLLMTYTFVYNYDANGSIRINATDSQGNPKGYFLLLNDASGNRVGFQGYDASDKLLFNYSYQYPDPTALGAVSLGSLSQVNLNSAGTQVQQALNLPDESSQTSQGNANTFGSLTQMLLGKLGY